MGKEFKGNERIGEEKLNNQGSLMRIIEYPNANNVIVEFQDEYKARVKSSYYHFSFGNIKNPYSQTVYGVGVVGDKYPSRINGKRTKEYTTWHDMLKRCFDDGFKVQRPTYRDITCCDEWLLFDNFYEWLHNQENFDKWLNGYKWDLDKDILVKGSKIYSPDTCCLVPHIVNGLFSKCDARRGNLPIGVSENKNGYIARCNNPITSEVVQLGMYNTPSNAFNVYKDYKENLIKQVAQEEYKSGNITKECYDAMMNYKVEITD